MHYSGTCIDGALVEVVLAKPVDKSDPRYIARNAHKNATTPVSTPSNANFTTLPLISYGVPAYDYSAANAAYYAQLMAPYVQQRQIINRNLVTRSAPRTRTGAASSSKTTLRSAVEVS